MTTLTHRNRAARQRRKHNGTHAELARQADAAWSKYRDSGEWPEQNAYPLVALIYRAALQHAGRHMAGISTARGFVFLGRRYRIDIEESGSFCVFIWRTNTLIAVHPWRRLS